MTEKNEIEKEFEELEQNDEWDDAFKNINSIETNSNAKLTFVHAKHSSNERLNRYRNILPYDHSRIKLKEANNTDYINANLVEANLANRKYILTQGPLPNTCEHFWQMVWEQNTKGIIMLNKLYEKGFLKCEMYFPNADEDNGDMTLKFGKFNLNYVSEIPFEDFSIRTIECENMEQKETREIYHLHFSNWPDFGEPEHTASFLKFLNECKKRNIFDSNQYGPPIVHCSAGVGRSGTFILVDSMIETYKIYGEKVPIKVSNLLAELRTYRMGLVQTHQQFKFAFQAIVDHVNQMRKPQEINEIELKEISDSDLSSDDDEDADEDDDDDESEKDNLITNTNNNNKRRRPDTAKRNNSKRFEEDEKHKKKIKNLRLLQQQNKPSTSSDANDDEQYKSLLNSEVIATAKPNKSVTSYINGDSKIQQLSSSENEEEEEDEDNTTIPFAKSSRNIQTVRVNQPRTPLFESNTQQQQQQQKNNNESEMIDNKKIGQSTDTTTIPSKNSSNTLNNITGNFEITNNTTNNNIKQRNVQSTSTENLNSSRTRILSDRDKRINEQVTRIKEKLIKHEQHKKIMSQLKPFLIGGSILLGSFLILQLYKKIF